MTESFSNNATPKYLGYVYQVLIAIEQCFQAKENQTIWIECFGDVYDGYTSIEVKHHFENTNLTNNSEDFWKTLKNLVIEDVSEFHLFVLHTTANIKEDSIFHNWNNIKKDEKYKKLKGHNPSETIKPYYDVIFKNKKSDLLLRLDKLIIKSSQLNIKDKWEELKNSKIFTLIDEKYRDDAFHWVYGYINKQAVNDRYNWHIKINDFNSAFRMALSKYTRDKIPFPDIDELDEIPDSSGFLFVKEMENIKLRKSNIQQAIFDYFRASRTQLVFIKNNPVICDILEKYDNVVLREISLLKNKYSANIEMNELNSEKSINTAKDLYFSSIALPLINIMNVSDTQKYYQDGRVHYNVNEGKFFWRISEEDIL